ncbi:MAG TPA: hypothetical protein VGA78_12855 [Gemmatimonadales bacterium]
MTRLTGPVAKGSTFVATLEFLREAGGPALHDRVLRGLGPADRKAIRGLTPTSEAPFPLLLRLWRSADAELASRDPGWIERAGAFSIASGGKRLYGGILQKESPLQFLTQSVSLFRLFYHPGDMEVVEEGPDRAVLRLVGFPPTDRLFCRRQTGGLQSALTIAGGSEPSVRHVRCELEGDAFCEWELRWR